MNVSETTGTIWIVFTAALGHTAIIWAAYRYIRQTLDHAKLGALMHDEEAELARLIAEAPPIEIYRSEAR